MVDKPQSDEDFFRLGLHRAFSDRQLRAMSYVRLCSELESAKAGTTAHMLIESEKRRRDSLPAEKPAEEPRHKPAPDHWYKKPIPVIIIAVVVGCILLAIRYLLRKHFNLDL